MRSFHAVAVTGSFTAGAKMLNVSQPPVTKHVKELEDRYGVELFYRHSRGAQLTEVGRRLLAIVQRIVANQTEAMDYLREAGSLRTGQLRIGAVNPFQVAEILSKFRAHYPKVGVTVTTGNSQDLVEELHDYRIDIAVIGQIGATEELEAIRYSQPQIVVIVNRAHPWSRRRDISISELKDQPIVLRETGSETRRVLEDAATRAGIVLTPSAEFTGREGLLAAVVHGMGVGAVSEDQLFDHKRLQKLRIRDADMHTDVLIVCLKERRDSRTIRAFMDRAAARIGRGRSANPSSD